jgi:ATP-binding cassette, subfamily F, member 3
MRPWRPVLIKARGISKAFGPKEVLRSVDIEIDRGDRVGLVGPNGAGKSTLLKILIGELKPDLGEISTQTDKIQYLPQFQDIGETTVDDACIDPWASAMQTKLEKLEALMANSANIPELDLHKIASEYGQLQEELTSRRGHEVEEKRKAALERVGMSERAGEDKVSELSGGERTRIMLARVLMQADDADLIILDEPTSHLDIETVESLEEYLCGFEGAVLIVSHDRYFMDQVVNRVWDLDGGKVNVYRGNYTEFVGKKMLDIERQRIASHKNQVERERMLKIAEEQHLRLRFASTHKTRLKMVDRMEDIQAPPEQKRMSINLPTVAKSGKNFVTLKQLVVNRGNRRVLDGVDLELTVGDKLGIFGPNGSGKTTLLKALIGEIPHKGEFWVAPGAKVGYFAQGHDNLNDKLTPEEQMIAALGEEEKGKARNLLSRFQLCAEHVVTPIGKLSGGERARVSLALLITEKRNLLLLDEPTNYLDILSREAVEGALREYKGAMILVTHDRYLLDAVCNKVGELRDGKLSVFNGTYSELKGQITHTTSFSDANVYRVVSGFTEWTSRRKYKPGDKVTIAPAEKELYQWALDNGKLKRVPGREVKRVNRLPEEQ